LKLVLNAGHSSSWIISSTWRPSGLFRRRSEKQGRARCYREGSN
jgi:hypothetical protein